MAFQAGNALFWAIVVNGELSYALLRLHWTDLVTRPAVYTIGISLGEDRSKTVENGQASAQRANHFAKESPMPHC